jgi:hypothetical protein
LDFFVAPCLGFITKQCQKYGMTWLNGYDSPS